MLLGGRNNSTVLVILESSAWLLVVFEFRIQIMY